MWAERVLALTSFPQGCIVYLAIRSLISVLVEHVTKDRMSNTHLMEVEGCSCSVRLWGSVMNQVKVTDMIMSIKIKLCS